MNFTYCDQKQPVFSVRRKVWRRDGDQDDTASETLFALRDSVLSAQSHCCGFCRFHAEKYQEVHHINHDHNDQRLSNLLTVCSLCHQVFHLGLTAMRASGFIAVLPELSQTEVNHLIRYIHVLSFIAKDRFKERLGNLYKIFCRRGGETILRLYGTDVSDPFVLAKVLAYCPDSLYERRQSILEPLRLVATADAFSPEQIEYYAAHRKQLFNTENFYTPLKRLLGAVGSDTWP